MDASPGSGSISVMIVAMKQGDQAAVSGLCQRYLARLTGVAKRRLKPSVCRICDGQDIAIEVFERMYFAAIAGRLKKVNNRGELWKALVISTFRRAAEVCRSESRQKRGGKIHERRPLEEIESPEPPVDLRLLLIEQKQYLMGLLRDNTLRKIARLRMDGQTVEQIAQDLRILPRSVARKLSLIRDKWLEELGGEPW